MPEAAKTIAPTMVTIPFAEYREMTQCIVGLTAENVRLERQLQVMIMNTTTPKETSNAS